MSALLHQLRNLNVDENIWNMFLFYDGCDGQNRYAHIVPTLCNWPTNESTELITEIQATFFVRGHSFFPAGHRVLSALKEVLKNNAEKTTLNYIRKCGLLISSGQIS